MACGSCKGVTHLAGGCVEDWYTPLGLHVHVCSLHLLKIEYVILQVPFQTTLPLSS